MTDAEIAAELALTERVGTELARYGLKEHVARLRQYYVAVRAGKPSKVWTHDMNVEWLRMLRLPPHQNDYPVQPRMSECFRCPVRRKYTAAVFPGGAKFTCGGCQGTWLELDDDTPPP